MVILGLLLDDGVCDKNIIRKVLSTIALVSSNNPLAIEAILLDSFTPIRAKVKSAFPLDWSMTWF